jgi:Arabinose efflux permease
MKNYLIKENESLTEKTRPVDLDGKAYNRTFLIIVLLVGAFCTILNQTLLSTALPKIMSDFHITASTGQWLTTAFLLMNGIMIPVTALMINKISSKTLYIISMTVLSDRDHHGGVCS